MIRAIRGLAGALSGRARSLLSLAIVALALATAGSFTPASAQAPALDGRIVFVKQQYIGGSSCCESAMFTIRPDGTEAARVTPYRGALEPDSGPVFSPEGLRIAYEGRPCPVPNPVGPCEAEIYVMLADGSFPTLLTYDPEIQLGGMPRPSWRPDGTRIAYTAVNEERSSLDIFETTIQGLSTRPLTSTSGFDEHSPVYSPDGRQIAFVGGGREQVVDWEIYVMDSDGSNPRPLTNGHTPGTLSWAPDGETIAFDGQVQEQGAFNGVSSDIFTVDVQSGEVRRITDSRGADGHPSYSPDGGRIAFASVRARRHENDPFGQSDVFTMNADGSDPVNVTADPSMQDYWPDWGLPLIGAVPPLPLPTSAVDACPSAREKLVIPGTRLSDELRGSPAGDVLLSGRRAAGSTGLRGDDCLFAGAGEDTLRGGPGDDVVAGGRNGDRLRCGRGRDIAFADRGDDVSRTCEKVR